MGTWVVSIVSAVMNSVTVDMDVQSLLEILLSYILCIYSVVELLDHMMILFLIVCFFKTCQYDNF